MTDNTPEALAVTHQWHEPSEHPDHGEPVIAEFHEWEVPTNPAKEHVVWWHEGKWRTYPNVDDRAYVNRWRRIPARHHSEGRTGAGEALEVAAGAVFSAIYGADIDPFAEPEKWEFAEGIAKTVLAALSQSTAGEDGA